MQQTATPTQPPNGAGTPTPPAPPTPPTPPAGPASGGSDEERHKASVMGRLTRNWFVWHLAALFANILLLSFALLVVYSNLGASSIKLGQLNIPVIPILLVLFTLYTWKSFEEVDINEGAVLSIFGWVVCELPNGPVYAPLFLSMLRITDLELLQKEIPSEPELVDRGDKDTVAEGYYPPVRITFAGKDGQDPLDRRITAEVAAILKIRPEKGNLREFFVLYNGDLAAAMKQAEDTIVTGLSETLPSRTAAEALRGTSTINVDLRTLIEEKLGKGGVEVDTANIKLFNFSHALNTSIQKPAQALAEGEATRIAGRAKGDATSYEAEGDAQAIEKLAAQGGDKPRALELIFARDTAVQVAKEVDTFIAVGADGLASPAATLGAVIKAVPQGLKPKEGDK